MSDTQRKWSGYLATFLVIGASLDCLLGRYVPGIALYLGAILLPPKSLP